MIYLPPPQPVLNKDIRVSGDVEIHPTASIAPGVILQAAPNYRIVIGADVCIGMGVIINAAQGSVEIDSGAILGSGVLIIGKSQIGSNSCIGTAVTIFQTNVEPMKVIEPGSVLGDTSRPGDLKPSEHDKANQSHKSSAPTKTSNKNSSRPGTTGSNYYFSSQNNKTIPEPESVSPSAAPSSAETIIQPDSKKAPESVVGQVYINQLLVTLFPQNKNFNQNGKKLE